MNNHYKITKGFLKTSTSMSINQIWSGSMRWWFCLLFICQSLASLAQTGKTVAGGQGVGANANQLKDPTNIYVTSVGVVYVADYNNNRIQRWAVGATTGTTVAGDINGVAGSAANQLNQPFGVFVDGSGAVYVADSKNNRIQKWAANATSGITIAGGNGAGKNDTQLNAPTGIYVTANGTLYVADFLNDRIQMFPPNSDSSTPGVTVAGGHGEGVAANQFRHAQGVVLDEATGEMYVADTQNHRIQKFPANSTSATAGVTIAGATGNVKGSDATHLDYPIALYRDPSNGDLYIADGYNDRIQKFPANSTSGMAGVTVAGGSKGSNATQLNFPQGIFLDAYKRIYVSDHFNNRVQRFGVCATSNFTPVATLSASGPITCSNPSITLTAGTASGSILGHTFFFSNGAYQLDGNSIPTTTVNQTGTYSVTVTNTFNDCESTASTPVTSNTAVPTATLSNNGPITCNNRTVTLTAGGTGTGAPLTYTFGSGASQIGATTKATVTQEGTYSVTVTDPNNGCTNFATTPVQSNTAPPNATLYASGVITCANNSVTLLAMGGVSYERLISVTVVNGYQIRNVEINNTGYYIVNGAGPHSITVIGTNGCQSIVGHTAPSNTSALPASLIASGTITCTTTSATLTASGGSSYTLINNQSGSQMTNTTGRFVVSRAGTYSVVVTGTNGCQAIAMATVLSNTTTPSASVVASGTITCTNTSATLTAAGGTVYTLNGQTNTTGIFTVSSSGMYSVLVTGPNGCTTSASATVLENTTAPMPSLAASGIITCSNTSATLTASGGATYTVNGQSNQTGVFVVNAAGMYSVIVMGVNGCTATASATVVGNTTAPPASLVASGTITCANTSAMLTATGGVSYALNGQTNTTGIFTVNAPGMYSVLVTGTNGCTALASTMVTSNTLAPIASVVASGTITCANNSAILTATGGVSYALNGQSNTTGTFPVSQTGTYSVIVTGSNGCTALASATVTGNTAAPTASLVASGTITCTNTSATLTAAGGTVYTLNGQTNTTGIFTVSSSGMYSVLVTGLNGCTASASATVLENTTAPMPSLAASGIITCSNTSATLTASGGATYTVNGQSNQTGVFVVNAAGMYSVIVMGVNGCTATASANVTSDQTTPTLSLAGNITFCQEQTSQLTATGAGSFRWNTGQTSATLSVSATGTYSVTLTASNGCTATASQLITAVACPRPEPTDPTPVHCGSPIATIGQPLVITGVTNANCNTGSFRILTTGGNGNPINFAGMSGVSNFDPYNCVRQMDGANLIVAINNPASDMGALTLRGVQVGGGPSSTFDFDFKQFCTNNSSTTTTPVSVTTPVAPVTPTPTNCGSPANTLGQPLVVAGITDVNCSTGSFRILTTGGNGNPINFAGIVGLNSANPYNCVRLVDGPDLVRAINNPTSDIGAFSLRGVQVGGATSNTFAFNFKQYCTGAARQAQSESVKELDVTVLGNPTSGDQVTIEIRQAGASPVNIRVSSAMGELVSEQTAQPVEGMVRTSVNLGRWTGIYLLQVHTPSQAKTVKVVRQ